MPFRLPYLQVPDAMYTLVADNSRGPVYDTGVIAAVKVCPMQYHAYPAHACNLPINQI